MCPSYMVTKEEMHSTRGRAHLLFEMLQGDPMKGGWKSETVKRGARPLPGVQGVPTECPMNVDMATYKAEFLSHYYEGRLRPRHAYAMGLIYWWARLASLAPGVVNLITHAPVVGKVFQGSAGSRPGATMPSFAPETFKAWFRRRPPRNVGQPARDPLARHVQQPLPPADGQGGRRGAGGRRVPGRRPARSRSAAAGRSTTSACSTRPSACSARSSTRSGPRSRRARRSSAWSRAAWRCFATSSSTSFRVLT